MDIDEFYEADPRRRQSAELELGTEWLDEDNVRHELNYVEDTGELYVLREPNSTQWLGDRLRAAGVAVGPTADPISDQDLGEAEGEGAGA